MCIRDRVMMWRYHEIYGVEICTGLNQRRNAVQQLGKKVHSTQMEEGKPINGKQLLQVAVRGKHLCELPTDTEDEEENKKNTKHNEDSKELRKRLDIYNDLHLASVMTNKVWSLEDRCMSLISNKITSSDEADLILQAVNAEKKWIAMCKFE